MSDHHRSIVLIGMMGAGKSSVGRMLQRKIGLDLVDLDDLLVARTGRSIPEIFAANGESTFRDMESSILAKLRLDRPAIIVTGGGIVTRPENLPHLKSLGTVIWLDADEDVLFERATRRGERPLLQTANPREKLTNLMEVRRPLYAAAADLRIDTTSFSHDEVVEEILSHFEQG